MHGNWLDTTKALTLKFSRQQPNYKVCIFPLTHSRLIEQFVTTDGSEPCRCWCVSLLTIKNTGLLFFVIASYDWCVAHETERRTFMHLRHRRRLFSLFLFNLYSFFLFNLVSQLRTSFHLQWRSRSLMRVFGGSCTKTCTWIRRTHRRDPAGPSLCEDKVLTTKPVCNLYFTLWLWVSAFWSTSLVSR